MRARQAWSAVLQRATFPRLMAVQAAGLAFIGVVMLAVKGAEWSFDAGVYRDYASAALSGLVPYRDYTVEYPPLALLPMILPALIVGTRPGAFVPALIAENILLMLGTGLVAWGMLRREFTPARARRGVAVHVVLTGILGLILLWRFDPLVALLGVLSVSAFCREKPFAAGVWAGLGVAAKLVPIFLLAVLASSLLAQRRKGDLLRLSLGCALALAGIFGPLVLVTAGKVFIFLRPLALRGIQIESISGGLLLLAQKLGCTTVEVEDTFGAYHLVSPWAGAILPVLPGLALVLLAGALVRAWMFFRQAAQAGGEECLRLVPVMAFFILLVGIITNKVFSPQYLIWLIPLAPFLRGRQIFLFTVICFLTVILFPLTYKFLVQMRTASVILLNVRNALTIVLAISLARGPGAIRQKMG